MSKVVGVKDVVMTKIAKAITEKEVSVLWDAESFTDGNDIYISYNAGSIEKWASLYHEILHVIHTPHKLFKRLEDYSNLELKRDLLNVAEDVRIESLAPLNVSALLQFNNINILDVAIKRIKKMKQINLQNAIILPILTHGLLGIDIENKIFEPDIAQIIRTTYPLIDSVRGSRNPDDSINVAELIYEILDRIVKKQRSSLLNSDVRKNLIEVGKNISKMKHNEELMQHVKESVSKNFSQFKTTSKYIIKILVKNENNKDFLKEKKVANRLAEDALTKIKGLSTLKNQISYHGRFYPELWVRNQIQPYWFIEREQSKELRRKHVALLVDISGSMSVNSRSIKAFIASRVFWIVMTKLYIPFTFMYFNEHSYQVSDIEHLTPLSINGTVPLSAIEKVPQEDQIIVVTDGNFHDRDICPSSSKYSSLSRRLWGIRIGDDNDYSLPDIFMRNRRFFVKNSKDLPQAVADVLMNILLY